MIRAFYDLRAYEDMSDTGKNIAFNMARKSAIIAAQEIIKAVDDFDNELYSHEGVRMPSHKEYYENVLFILNRNN